MPDDEGGELAAVAASVTDSWGMIPVSARIGRTSWQTSLFPKAGGYIVPVKAAVQRAEALKIGDTVSVRLMVDV